MSPDSEVKVSRGGVDCPELRAAFEVNPTRASLEFCL